MVSTFTGRGPEPGHLAAGTTNVAVPNEGAPVEEVVRNFTSVACVIGALNSPAAVAVMSRVSIV